MQVWKHYTTTTTIKIQMSTAITFIYPWCTIYRTIIIPLAVWYTSTTPFIKFPAIYNSSRQSCPNYISIDSNLPNFLLVYCYTANAGAANIYS